MCGRRQTGPKRWMNWRVIPSGRRSICFICRSITVRIGYSLNRGHDGQVACVSESNQTPSPSQCVCDSFARCRAPIMIIGKDRNKRPCIVPLSPPTPAPTITLSSTNKLALALMSHPHFTVVPSSTSNFQIIINNALNLYKKRTKNDLRAHPLAVRLQTCDSPSAIIAVLQEKVQELDQSRSTDERWTK